jgi:hypothetical protein
MKRGYLYLVFITLSVVVGIVLALVFKFTTTTHSTLSTLVSDNDSKELRSLMRVQTFEDSWIQKISKEKNQKEYLYPVEKFHIEFN